MVGNKNSGRRDSLPRGGGRPRSRLIIHADEALIRRVERVARYEETSMSDVVRVALRDYLRDWEDDHSG